MPAGGAGDSPSGDGPPAAGAAAGGGDQACPNCGDTAGADALFCENCGYDYTTGSMPRRGGATPADDAASGRGGQAVGNISSTLDATWVAEVWVDPAWYASQSSPDPLPSAAPPQVLPLRHSSLLVGRVSRSRDIHPDIDCGADNGVSRRHAQLTSDGTRWWVEDLSSSNGTYIGDAVGELPTSALPPGQKREVDADHRIYLGSWTRIVVRRAEDGEV